MWLFPGHNRAVSGRAGQHATHPGQAAFHRPDGDIQFSGDIAVTFALNHHQTEDPPIPGFQGGQGAIQILEAQTVDLVGRLMDFHKPILNGNMGPPSLPPARTINEQIMHDGEQPGAHIGPRLEAVKARHAPFQTILQQIVGAVGGGFEEPCIPVQVGNLILDRLHEPPVGHGADDTIFSPGPPPSLSGNLQPVNFY